MVEVSLFDTFYCIVCFAHYFMECRTVDEGVMYMLPCQLSE